MSERPPIPRILTEDLSESIATALQRVKDVFAARYPEASSIVSVGQQNRIEWDISHHHNGHCVLAQGATPERAFAELDRKLGPPMTAMERLKWRCEQLMREAIAMEAYEVANALKAAHQSPLPPASSPVARQ